MSLSGQGWNLSLLGIIAGGVVAGVVITLSGFTLVHLFLMEEFQSASERFNLLPPPPWIFFTHVASRMTLGIVSVALYSFLRNRFPSRAQGGVTTGVFIWLLAYVFFALGILGFGLFSARFYFLWVSWGFAEAVLATMAGAWVYDRTSSSTGSVRLSCESG